MNTKLADLSQIISAIDEKLQPGINAMLNPMKRTPLSELQKKLVRLKLNLIDGINPLAQNSSGQIDKLTALAPLPWPYETGVHVRLSSGGPTMVVSDIHPDGTVETVWFNEAGDVNRSAFHKNELLLVRGAILRCPLKQLGKTAGAGWRE